MSNASGRAKKGRSAALFALALALASCAAGDPEAGGVKRFPAALRLADPSPLPPAGTDPRYRPTLLPEFWRIERRLAATNVWYRMSLPLEETPRQRWAVYLPRVGLNAAVYVNGVAVGDGGRSEEHTSELQSLRH